VWVGVNSKAETSGVQPLDSGVLGALANYNPSGSALDNQKKQADVAATNANTELVKQQTEALELENQARRRQLQQEGAIPAPAQTGTRYQKADRKFDERIAKARARHSDFNAVVGREDFVPTPTIQKAIFRSRVAGELAYWLAQHPEDCRRIAALPEDSAMHEIRKIESTLMARRN